MSKTAQKIEYLISSSLPNDVELKNFDFDPDFGGNLYFVFTTVDLTKFIDSLSVLFKESIKVENIIVEILSKYLFDENGRFLDQKERNIQVNVGSDLDQIDFKQDEKCLITLNFIVGWS